VPSHTAIYAGKGVSIVLKEDQPTGHEVRGIVADLLTRGDHPRGVKVRLRDGRVGRVQRLCSEEEGEKGEGLVGGRDAGLGRNGEGAGGGASGGIGVGGRRGGRGGFVHVRDIREDDEYFYDEQSVPESRGHGGLFAALEAADKEHEELRGWDGEAGEIPQGEGVGGSGSEVAKCPVCGVFEGDERAVAFHVEEHF
ncbi:hypothetical protein CC80DRAFT_385642, partial [Byssothecium circinans]